MSRKRRDKLNADGKALITEAAAQATAYQRGVSRTQADIALDDLKKTGMQVTELPPAEMAKLRDEQLRTLGRKLGAEVQAAPGALASALASALAKALGKPIRLISPVQSGARGCARKYGESRR